MFVLGFVRKTCSVDVRLSQVETTCDEALRNPVSHLFVLRVMFPFSDFIGHKIHFLLYFTAAPPEHHSPVYGLFVQTWRVEGRSFRLLISAMKQADRHLALSRCKICLSLSQTVKDILG